MRNRKDNSRRKSVSAKSGRRFGTQRKSLRRGRESRTLGLAWKTFKTSGTHANERSNPFTSRPAYDADRRIASDYFGRPPDSPSTGSGDSRPPSFPSSTEDVRRNSLAQSSQPSSLHESSVEDLRPSNNRRQASASEAVTSDNRRMSSSSRPVSVASSSRGTLPRSFSTPSLCRWPSLSPFHILTLTWAWAWA